MVFYDKHGNPCCYSDDFKHIYGYDGEPLGYIQDGLIWNYNGRYLGQFKNNWVLDKDGYYLFFTENATGGPIRPIRKIAPIKSVKEIRPLKNIREIPPVYPVSKLDWSQLDPKIFFRNVELKL